MSNNPHPSDNGRPMPPNYSQASGPQQPYAQHPGDQPYGSQQQGQQSYGSQQYGQQSPGYGPQSYQQGGPQPGYAPHSTAAASAFSPAAGVPVGAPLPEAAYGSGSVGFWTADQTERTTALWSHLAHAATYVVGLGWIVTLVLYLINKDRSPFIRHHGAQSLNLLIIGVIAVVGLGFIGGVLSIVGIGLLILLLIPVVSIYMIVIEIIAGLAANRGEGYRIPMTPNWIK
ncbi:MAG TPA: DUF4870 domain-containing protein [Candidatus Brevibacterium intestinavium]|jgi:uncharacterized Tic20 family protein|nr:DUF4870 domain-containing protein [Candidatus Brevibacterium intestinavium]